MMQIVNVTRHSKAISLTPLIDIVFILLMFFMLTSSFTQERQLGISSPSTNPNETEEKPIRLWVLNAGQLVDQNAEPIDETTLAAMDRSRTIIVHPEAATTAQTIVSLFVRLKNSGLVNVSLGRSFGTTVPSSDS